MTLGGSPVNWCSRLQTSVGMSSCEAECFAIAAAVVEVDYLRGLLGEINGVIDHPRVPNDPTIVHVDNQSAIYDAYNRT